MVFGNNKLDELIKYNEKLSTLYKDTGPGMMGGKYNLEFDELINYPNGSCSQQGYLLARKAKELGFKSQQIGLFAKTGANDVMVNVSDGINQFLFVSSAGAYYKNSLWQIFENIELANEFFANKTEKENVLAARNLYLSPSFFETIDSIKIYHLNNYETNLLKLSRKSSSKNLFEYPYNEKHLLDYQNKYYTAGKNNKENQSIEYIFDNSIIIYRFYFQWYSNNDYAKKIKIKINDKQTLKFENSSNGLETEIVLPESIKEVKKIEFIFSDFNGQNRLLLKQLGAY
jgi:hypothetical protein